MFEPPGTADRTDRSADATDRSRTAVSRVRRVVPRSVALATALHPTRLWTSWYERFDVDRPPHRLLAPLVLAAVLDGFLAFSSVWTGLGDLVVAVPAAAVAGVGVGAGTVFAGLLVWARVTRVPAGH